MTKIQALFTQSIRVRHRNPG